MKYLSSTLLDAQKSESRLPYVRVEVVERVGGVTRLIWSRLYTGIEPDFYHAATMPGDGSLVRLRVDPNTHNLYRQRVTSPGPESDFSSWTLWSNSTYAVALASFGEHVFCLRVAANGWLAESHSSDYGQNWTGWSYFGSTAGPAFDVRVAVAYKDSTTILFLYAAQGILYRRLRVGDDWGSWAAWTNSLASISGVSVVYHWDWNVIVSGQDSSNNYKVCTCVYGDGYSATPGTWSPLAELILSSAGSGVEFHYPYLACPDVFRAFFVEKYEGPDVYSRPLWSHSLVTADFISNLWREPVPFNLASSYGVAITHHDSYVWLCTAFGVWRAPRSPAAVELTDDVVEISAVTEVFSGRIAVVLRNDDGRYKEAGSGDYAAIKAGSELLVYPGYRTTVGAEFSLGPAYWIESWEYVSEAGRSYFVLHGRDGRWLLDHWRARRQFSWAQGEKNIFQLLSFLLARAGLEVSAFSTSEALVNQYPAFTIHPRESGATAVRRLLEMVPDVLFFLRDCGYLKNPVSDEESVYSYGTDHAIFEARYTSGTQEINRVQVYGDGIMRETFDWDEIAKIYDRLGQVHDLNLDTLAKAKARGEAELREQAIAASGGEILVPLNCGQDLYDVVEITDERAGLSSVRRRVVGMTLRYSTSGREARYEQRLRLGGV
ncbi:hypothetical protein ES703_07031 [subsurface metagenome]